MKRFLLVLTLAAATHLHAAETEEKRQLTNADILFNRAMWVSIWAVTLYNIKAILANPQGSDTASTVADTAETAAAAVK